jgi:hypothetical protein
VRRTGRFHALVGTLPVRIARWLHHGHPPASVEPDLHVVKQLAGVDVVKDVPHRHAEPPLPS